MSDDRRPLTTRDVAAAAATKEELPRNNQPRPQKEAPVSTTHDEDIKSVNLFPKEEGDGYRSQWEAVQTGFVDEPKAAVEQADALVAQVVTRLAQVFSEERAQLERQWAKGDSISTEDLRVALKRYRAFFHRLLTV